MIFRRRSTEKPDEVSAPAEAPAEEQPADRPNGPWDRSETTVDEDDDTYVDLGGLVVKGAEGLELRLQVDENTSAVAAVLLAGKESGLELRAFAAPRREGIWDEVRKDIAAEASRRGGTATELEGEYGTELSLVVPIETPDGRKATQHSRVVGVDGPRWLLRGTFLGKSAEQADTTGLVETAFRDVIVVRGDGPMSPRDMLPMQMPPQARSAMESQQQNDAADHAEGDDSASS